MSAAACRPPASLEGEDRAPLSPVVAVLLDAQRDLVPPPVSPQPGDRLSYWWLLFGGSRFKDISIEVVGFLWPSPEISEHHLWSLR